VPHLLKNGRTTRPMLDDELGRLAAGGTVADPALVSVLFERQRSGNLLAARTRQPAGRAHRPERGCCG
jgi:hypothetical protein